MAEREAEKIELQLDVQVSEEFVDRVPTDLLRKLIERALANEGMGGRVEMSLVVTDDETVHRLNLTYRGVDQTTDVLSFPLQPAPGKKGRRFLLPPDEVLHLGDVVISFPRAVEQAVQYGNSLEREMGYLTVHGVLHLLGYDHRLRAEREQMREKEEAALIDLPR